MVQGKEEKKLKTSMNLSQKNQKQLMMPRQREPHGEGRKCTNTEYMLNETGVEIGFKLVEVS